MIRTSCIGTMNVWKGVASAEYNSALRAKVHREVPTPEDKVIDKVIDKVEGLRRAMRGIVVAALLGFSLAETLRAAEVAPEQGSTRVRAQLTNNVARALRYFPENGDFVITNGTEFFNRPLYC